MALLQCRDLTCRIDRRLLCDRLKLEVNPGECWAILGSNGSGKTTLLHTLAGLRQTVEGEILLDDTPLSTLPRKRVAQRMGLLLQETHDPFPASVWETVLSGRHPHLGRWRSESEQDREQARRALMTMDLQELESRAVQSLSGGERRRLAIATLLTQDPALLLLDEPLNHLDLRHRQTVLQHLRRLCSDQGKAVVMVLHDPNQALRYCDRVLLLEDNGAWQAGESRTLLSTEALTRLYGYPLQMVEHDGKRLFLPQ